MIFAQKLIFAQKPLSYIRNVIFNEYVYYAWKNNNKKKTNIAKIK